MKRRNHISRKGSTGPIAIKLTAVISGTPLEIELTLPDKTAQSLKETSSTSALSRTTGDGLAHVPLSPPVVRCNRRNGRAGVNTRQPADMMCSILRSDADAGPYQFDLTTGTPFGTPMTRSEVAMRYPCPRCGAVGGQRCQGRNRARKSNHIERWEVAAKALGLLTR